jgi:hypothetical protein
MGPAFRLGEREQPKGRTHALFHNFRVQQPKGQTPSASFDWGL